MLNYLKKIVIEVVFVLAALVTIIDWLSRLIAA